MSNVETLLADNGAYWSDKEDGYCIDIKVVADHGKLTEKYGDQKWASAFAPDTRVIEVDAVSFKHIEAISKGKCIRAPVAKKGERFVMVQCKRDVLPGNARQFILLEHKTRHGEYNIRHLMHNDDDYYDGSVSSSDEEGEESPLDVDEKQEKEPVVATPAVAAASPAPASPQVPAADGKKSFAAVVASVSTSAVEEFPPLPSSPTQKKNTRSKEEIFAELQALKQREVELLKELMSA